MRSKCMAVLHLKTVVPNDKTDPTRGYGIFIENMLEAAK